MKWFFASMGVAIGILVALLAHDYYEFVERTKAFEIKGARFTAQDGQNLCLRLQLVEPRPKPCEYTKDAP